MKVKQIFIAALFTIPTFSSAQSNVIDSLDPKIEALPPQSKKTTRQKGNGEEQNILKIGALYFVSGNIPLYYERKIMPWLSIQAGIGLTSRDFVADVVNWYLDNINQDEGLNPYYQYKERKPLVGVYASLQPKFYVIDPALAGFWISPMVEFKQYNFKANLSDVNSSSNAYLPNTYQHEHRNVIDFTINTGYQWMFNVMTLEASTGLGFRRFWEQRIDVEYAGTNGGAPYTTNGVRNFKGYRFEYNISLNFGGFF